MHHPAPASADAFAISHAFRAASDDDTMKVMNLFSSKKESELQELKFYVVPAEWMRKAWPILTTGVVPDNFVSPGGDDWREEIGSIETRGLLVEFSNNQQQQPQPHQPDSISDEDDNNNKINDDSSNKQQKNLVLDELEKRAANSDSDTAKSAAALASRRHNGVQNNNLQRGESLLRNDLVHEKDFFLMGANAWLLVKAKFGVVDSELPCRCVFHNHDEHPLAVELYPPGHYPASAAEAAYIPIPPTGRFRYETVLSTTSTNGNNNSFNNFKNNSNSNSNSNMNDQHPGNVSDDDTECGDDLFPADGDDDRMSTDQHNSSQPVLLLSNSPANNGTDNKSSWLQSNGMDGDKEKTTVPSDSKFFFRYGSGLGNMGNTCFMNSTLQCLAHTDPLRKYFLSGEYERDLNRDNPLGTGGELATQFAQLVGEMWGCKRGKSSSNPASTGPAIYPRNFKLALGRHAEQFVGYDQHDSQELATYLLDALHEDTNRITVKPYVEKPEQGEDETDEEAADKSWALHLKREDSRVLDYLMGQVKSRVQCCKSECGKVSTTFDPFMFLSVPIPGYSDRTMRVTFVPLDPNLRAQDISVTLNKNGKIEDICKKLIDQLKKLQIVAPDDPISREDFCVVDVWQREIYTIFQDKDEIDRIRDNDETFVYHLKSLKEVRLIEKGNNALKDSVPVDAGSLGLRERSSPKKYKLDLPTLTRINRGDEWSKMMTKYLRSELGFLTAFNPKRGTSAERVKMYNKLMLFIDQCYQDADPELTGQKRSREDSDDLSDVGQVSANPDEAEVPAIRERSDSSMIFHMVTRRHDVAMLEFLAGKMRAEILRLEKSKQVSYPDGITLQVRLRKHSSTSVSKEQNIAAPLVLRVISNTTVYGLREIIAHRLSRSLRLPGNTSGEPSAERALQPQLTDNTFGSPELMLIRQIPMTYERKSLTAYRSYTGAGQKLGSLEKSGRPVESGSRAAIANPTDSEEAATLAEILGGHAIVHMEWPEELADEYLDVNELEAVDTPASMAMDNDAAKERKSSTLNVLECIEKFCQMEQLEETEMWYCNRCKEHVRAWKQFHIYRSPPILIVHLKRFQYSATTHRRDKINVFVDFPLEGLDLTKHVMHWTEDDKPIYDCYAVSNHYGGLGGGHYTAYCSHDDGVWCYYDDGRITTQVDPKEAVSQAAYVLYYRRRDVPTGEDFVMSVNSDESPAIIHDPMDKIGESPPGGGTDDVSSSNAAMVDEDDGMEVDDTGLDNRSVGSMDEHNDSDADAPPYVNGPQNMESVDDRGVVDVPIDDQFPLQ